MTERLHYPQFSDLPRPACSYLICANYRSGSTLLGSSLEQIDRAGKPREYFAAILMPRHIERWHAKTPEHFSDYMRLVLENSMTPSGAFGAKIMYPDMGFLIHQLREMTGDHITSEHDLLEAVFPNLRYIHLTRRDMLRQGISNLRAVQSSVWHSVAKREDGDQVSRLEFNLEEIDKHIHLLIHHNLSWEHFFARNQIT